MASIQKKGNGWYCTFYHANQRHTFAVGRVDEAEAIRARTDYVLMRLRQGLMEIPPGSDVVTFVRHDGKPPIDKRDSTPAIAFRKFRDSYLEAFSHGAMESNSLSTASIHFTHIAETLGETFPLEKLAACDLQRHIDRRLKKVAGVTIKKEIDTFRSAWNWAMRMGYVRGAFPGNGLIFPKEREKLPFMTRSEIERRLQAGGDADELWECLYLTMPEVSELLGYVRTRKAPHWVYPMLLLAAHTGARRSEMIRARA